MSQAAGYGFRLTSYPVLVTILGAATAASFSIGSVPLSIISMFLWLSIGPFLAGETIRWFVRKLVARYLRSTSDPLLRFPFLVHFGVSWWSGLLFLYLVAAFLWSLGYFSVVSMAIVFAITSGISPLVNLTQIRRQLPDAITRAGRAVREKRASLVTIIASSAAVFLLVRSFSPPPFQVGWDLFTHLFITDQLRLNSVFFLLPQSFSNSIFTNPYTTSFHALTSAVTFLGNGDVLLLFWIGPLFTLSVFAAGMVFISKKAGLSMLVVASVVALGLVFQEWQKASALIYLSPSSLITAFTPLILGSQLVYSKINRIWSLHFASAGILITHFFTGALLLVVSYAVPVARGIFRGRPMDYRALSFTVIALASLFVLILAVGWTFFNGLLDPLTDFLVSSGTLFDRVQLSRKIDTLTRHWYTLPLLVSAVSGTLLLATRSLVMGGMTTRSRRTSIIGLVMMVALIVYLIELEQTSRFLFLVRPGIFLLTGVLALELSRGLVRRGSSVLSVLVIALIASSTVYPYASFMNTQRFEGDTDGIATSFADYEMKMGIWIRENLPQGILIVSDPETQRMIQGFALRETLFGWAMPVQDEVTIKLVFLANTTQDASRMIRTLVEDRGYDPKESYLLVSGRTLFWAQNDIRHVFRPRDVNDPEILEIFAGPEFQLVHQVEEDIFLYRLG